MHYKKHVVLIVLGLILLTGCGKAKELNEVWEKYRILQTKHNKLKADYNSLKDKYEEAQERLQIHVERSKKYIHNFHDMVKE